MCWILEKLAKKNGYLSVASVIMLAYSHMNGPVLMTISVEGFVPVHGAMDESFQLCSLNW